MNDDEIKELRREIDRLKKILLIDDEKIKNCKCSSKKINKEYYCKSCDKFTIRVLLCLKALDRIVYDPECDSFIPKGMRFYN